MVDYTTKQSSGGMWIYIVAAVVVLGIVYAIFAGSGSTPATELGTPAAEPATQAAPAITD